MADHGHAHWEVLKWILRCLNETILFGIVYKQSTHSEDAIKGFVDLDYSRNVDTSKSLFWYVFTLFGTVVC